MVERSRRVTRAAAAAIVAAHDEGGDASHSDKGEEAEGSGRGSRRTANQVLRSGASAAAAPGNTSEAVPRGRKRTTAAAAAAVGAALADKRRSAAAATVVSALTSEPESNLLARLLEDAPDVFEHHFLPKLTAEDRTLLAQSSMPLMVWPGAGLWARGGGTHAHAKPKPLNPVFDNCRKLPPGFTVTLAPTLYLLCT